MPNRSGLVFAPTYRAARSAFIRAAERLDASIACHQAPSASPEGEPLFTDVAILGPPEARRAVVVLSATHGVEGFAGSALQTDVLATASAWRADTLAIFVHALNPFGFAWLRRVDQDNVDLNRNFIDHAAPPANPEYEALHAALCPLRWTRESQELGDRAVMVFEAERGAGALANVLARGQYAHPDGLFYGGRAPSWSNRLLRAVLADLPPTVEELALVDIHTGLGAFAACQIICGVSSAATDPMPTALPGAIDSTMDIAPPGVRFTPVTMEFGTAAPLSVLKALRADNWLHCHGGAGRIHLAHPIKRDMLAAFCPLDAGWQARVLASGREVIARLLRDGRA